jgi:hypothetical protein
MRGGMTNDEYVFQDWDDEQTKIDELNVLVESIENLMKIKHILEVGKARALHEQHLGEGKTSDDEEGTTTYLDFLAQKIIYYNGYLTQINESINRFKSKGGGKRRKTRKSPRVMRGGNNGPDDECLICMEQMTSDTSIDVHATGVSSNNARHYFHINCINSWQPNNQQAPCPLCNTPGTLHYRFHPNLWQQPAPPNAPPNAAQIAADPAAEEAAADPAPPNAAWFDDDDWWELLDTDSDSDSDGSFPEFFALEDEDQLCCFCNRQETIATRVNEGWRAPFANLNLDDWQNDGNGYMCNECQNDRWFLCDQCNDHNARISALNNIDQQNILGLSAFTAGWVQIQENDQNDPQVNDKFLCEQHNPANNQQGGKKKSKSNIRMRKKRGGNKDDDLKEAYSDRREDGAVQREKQREYIKTLDRNMPYIPTPKSTKKRLTFGQKSCIKNNNDCKSGEICSGGEGKKKGVCVKPVKTYTGELHYDSPWQEYLKDFEPIEGYKGWFYDNKTDTYLQYDLVKKEVLSQGKKHPADIKGQRAMASVKRKWTRKFGKKAGTRRKRKKKTRKRRKKKTRKRRKKKTRRKR